MIFSISNIEFIKAGIFRWEFLGEEELSPTLPFLFHVFGWVLEVVDLLVCDKAFGEFVDFQFYFCGSVYEKTHIMF